MSVESYTFLIQPPNIPGDSMGRYLREDIVRNTRKRDGQDRITLDALAISRRDAYTFSGIVDHSPLSVTTKINSPFGKSVRAPSNPEDRLFSPAARYDHDPLNGAVYVKAPREQFMLGERTRSLGAGKTYYVASARRERTPSDMQRMFVESLKYKVIPIDTHLAA